VNTKTAIHHARQDHQVVYTNRAVIFLYRLIHVTHTVSGMTSRVTSTVHDITITTANGKRHRTITKSTTDNKGVTKTQTKIVKLKDDVHFNDDEFASGLPVHTQQALLASDFNAPFASSSDFNAAFAKFDVKQLAGLPVRTQQALLELMNGPTKVNVPSKKARTHK